MEKCKTWSRRSLLNYIMFLEATTIVIAYLYIVQLLPFEKEMAYSNCQEWIDYVDTSPASLGCGDCIVERVVKICE